MSNEELYNKAMDAVRDLFADQSVTEEETKRNLQSLIDEIQGMMDSLKP